jgi:hypothetical protein
MITYLGSRDVLGLSEPSLEARLLEGATVGEGQRPGSLAGEGVHDGEVDGSLLLAHATGKESDTGNGSGHSALEGLDGPLADVLGLDTLLAVSAGDGHGGLEEGSLKVNSVLRAGLVNLSENLLLDGGGPLDAVVAVHENLRLDDGHEASLLAGAGIAGKTPCGLEKEEEKVSKRMDLGSCYGKDSNRLEPHAKPSTKLHVAKESADPYTCRWGFFSKSCAIKFLPPSCRAEWGSCQRSGAQSSTCRSEHPARLQET